MVLEYNGHKGSVEYDAEKEMFSGTILGLKNTNFVYEAKDLESLIEEFQDAVDDYIDLMGEIQG